MNLVCSSLKYTASGAIKISASQTHSAAQVVVADTGAGIPPQQLQQALDPFEMVRLSGFFFGGGVWCGSGGVGGGRGGGWGRRGVDEGQGGGVSGNTDMNTPTAVAACD